MGTLHCLYQLPPENTLNTSIFFDSCSRWEQWRVDSMRTGPALPLKEGCGLIGYSDRVAPGEQKRISGVDFTAFCQCEVLYIDGSRSVHGYCCLGYHCLRFIERHSLAIIAIFSTRFEN